MNLKPFVNIMCKNMIRLKYIFLHLLTNKILGLLTQAKVVARRQHGSSISVVFILRKMSAVVKLLWSFCRNCAKISGFIHTVLWIFFRFQSEADDVTLCKSHKELFLWFCMGVLLTERFLRNLHLKSFIHYLLWLL